MDIYKEFGPSSFAVLERRLARKEFISGPELAFALRANPGVMPPPAVRDYEIRLLEGTAKKPRGRKPHGLVLQFWNLYTELQYDRYLARLQRLKPRSGKFKSKSGDEFAPNEAAAHMVSKLLRRNQSARRIQNLVSRQRRLRKRSSS